MNMTLLRAGTALLGQLAPDATARHARRLFMTPQRHAPRPWERVAEESGERITLAGNLRALRWGRAEDPAVLLMHGWEGRATQWARFVGPLLALGKHVVALDGPAHGQSPGREANVLEFARAVLAAGATLGPLDAVVGHSMGAAAAAVALSQGLRARRFVSIASPSSVSGVLERFVDLVGLPPGAARRFERLVTRSVGISPRDVDVAALGPLVAHVPGLVLHDPEDAEIPFADARAIAAAWPGARLVPLEGVGHRRVLADEEVVELVRDFVGR